MNLIQEAMHIPETAVAPGMTLSPWDINPAVAEMQELLRAHGYGVPVNGDFDWKTEVAVKAYQRRHQLKVDAIVGPETWISLKSTVKPGVRILREGCSGADVYELQGLLQIQGYVVKRDGVFGAETRSAVVTFQQRQHLQATGMVNPVTWALLAERKDVYQKRKR